MTTSRCTRTVLACLLTRGRRVRTFGRTKVVAPVGWSTRTPKEIHSGNKSFGDYDVNVGEIGAIESVLTWLKDSGKHDRDKRREVHIFTDSDLTYNWLTEPGCHTKYYRAVQRTRRLAARLPKYQFILHWIPSHLSKHFEEAKDELEIPGNAAADAKAGDARATAVRVSTFIRTKAWPPGTSRGLLCARPRGWCIRSAICSPGIRIPDPDKSSPTTDPAGKHSVCDPCEEPSSVSTASEI